MANFSPYLLSMHNSASNYPKSQRQNMEGKTQLQVPLSETRIQKYLLQLTVDWKSRRNLLKNE